MTTLIDAIRSAVDGLYAVLFGGFGPSVAKVDGAVMCLLTRIDSEAAMSVARSAACL